MEGNYIELTLEEYYAIMEAREALNEFKSDIKNDVDARLASDKLSGTHGALSQGRKIAKASNMHDITSRQGSGIHARTAQDKRDIDSANSATNKYLKSVQSAKGKEDIKRRLLKGAVKLNDKPIAQKVAGMAKGINQ